MAPAYDHCRIDEIECTVIHRSETQSVKFDCARLGVGWDPFKPSQMQEIQAMRMVVSEPWTNELDVCMVNSDDASIAEAMLRCFLGESGLEHHNVAVIRVRVDCVLATANVVSSVVYAEYIVLVYATALE